MVHLENYFTQTETWLPQTETQALSDERHLDILNGGNGIGPEHHGGNRMKLTPPTETEREWWSTQHKRNYESRLIDGVFYALDKRTGEKFVCHGRDGSSWKWSSIEDFPSSPDTHFEPDFSLEELAEGALIIESLG